MSSTNIFTFADHIDYVNDGEPIDEVTANRCIRQLAANTDYLLSLLDRLRSRQAVILNDQLLAANVKLGQVVYYDLANSCFAPATIEYIQQLGLVEAADSTYCWGVVCSINDGVGDILVSGMAHIDMTESIIGTPAPGLYYLSPAVPGMLVNPSPSVSLPIAFLYTRVQGNVFEVFVSVSFNDLFRNHRHYRLDMPTVPCGTYTAGNNTISTVDPSLTGWLPANHSSFAGSAPANAKFGYNLEALNIRSGWPPVPITLMSLDLAVSELTPDKPPRFGGLTEDICVIDNNGIWWMSDQPSLLPWDSTRSYTAGVPSAAREYEQYLRLWYTKIDLDSNSGYVSSLVGDSDAGITVTDRDTGLESDYGDLRVSFNLKLLTEDRESKATKAVKDMDGNKLILGPVMTGLKVNGTDISISSAENQDSDGFNYGRITLQSINTFSGSELLIESNHLLNAQTSFINGFLGITLPAGRRTGTVGRVSVPKYNINPTNPVFKVRLGILVTQPGNIPDSVLSITTRTIPYNYTLQTPVTVDTTETVAAINAGAAIDTSGTWPKVYFVESAWVPFNLGDSLFITVERNSTDNFNGDLTLIRQSIILGTA